MIVTRCFLVLPFPCFSWINVDEIEARWLKAFPGNRNLIVREHEDANVWFEVDETLSCYIWPVQQTKHRCQYGMKSGLCMHILTMRGDCTISLTLAKPPYLKSGAECIPFESERDWEVLVGF